MVSSKRGLARIRRDFIRRLMNGGSYALLCLAPVAVSLGVALPAAAGVVLTPGNTTNDTYTVPAGTTVQANDIQPAIFGPAGTDWTVSNQGTVLGYQFGTNPTPAIYGDAIYFAGNGAVQNAATGFIGGATGVHMLGGNINNQGTISGIDAGITLTTDGTIVNSGTITAANASGIAVRFGSGASLLQLLAGSSIVGGLDGGTGTSALELMSGVGTLTSNVTNFDTVTVDAGGAWTFAGSLSASSLTNAGTLTNNGQILNPVTLSGATAHLTNTGTITGGMFAAGVTTNGGSVDNSTSTAVINGATGVLGTGFATIANSGTIVGFGDGVILTAGGVVTNNAGGLIQGDIALSLMAAGSVTNAGLIQGRSNVGVFGRDGVTVTNSGTITSGAQTAVSMIGGGVVVNAAGGTISGGQYGVSLTGPGTITNAGTISGNPSGVSLGGGGALINTGVVTGASGVAVAFAAGGGSLTLDTGSVLNGRIDGGGVADTVTLTGTGALSDGMGGFGGGSSLTKSGSGQWTLTGDNTVPTTTVSGGKLIVDGALTSTVSIGSGASLAVGQDEAHKTASLSGDVTVNAGGALSGHGGVIGNLSNLGGTVEPGGSVGTLTVSGNYSSTASSNLLVQVTPTAASLLKVGGTASLAGTLTLVYAPGVYTAAELPLVQSTGALSGTFSAVVESGETPTGLTRSVTYGANAAALVLVDPSVIEPADGSLFGSLQTALISGSRGTLTMLLDRPAMASDAICIGNPALARSGTGQAVLSDDTGARDLCANGGWVRAYGAFSQGKGLNSAPGFKASGGGFLAGMSRQGDDGLSLGFAAGYTRTDLDDSLHGSGAADTVRLALYGSKAAGAVVASAALAYAHHDIDTKRQTGAGQAVGETDADEVDFGLQAAMPMSLGATVVTPKVGFNYATFREHGFTETAPGAFGVTAHTDNADSLQPFVSVSMTRTYAWASGWRVTPELRLGYRRELLDSERRGGVTSATGFNFTTEGSTPGRDVGTVGLSLTWLKTDRFSFLAAYDADFAARSSSNQLASLGLRFTF